MLATDLNIPYGIVETSEVGCDGVKTSLVNIGEYLGRTIVGIMPASHPNLEYRAVTSGIGAASSHAKLHFRCNSTHQVNTNIRMVGTRHELDFVPMELPVISVISSILPQHSTGEISTPYWDGTAIVSNTPIRCTLNVRYSSTIKYYTNNNSDTGYILVICKKTGEVIEEYEIEGYVRPEDPKPEKPRQEFGDPIVIAEITYKCIVDNGKESDIWAYTDGYPDKYFENGKRTSIVEIDDVSEDKKPNVDSCAVIEKPYVVWYAQAQVKTPESGSVRRHGRAYKVTTKFDDALQPFGVGSQFKPDFTFKVSSRPTDDVEADGNKLTGMDFWGTAAHLYDTMDFDSIFKEYKDSLSKIGAVLKRA